MFVKNADQGRSGVGEQRQNGKLRIRRFGVIIKNFEKWTKTIVGAKTCNKLNLYKFGLSKIWNLKLHIKKFASFHQTCQSLGNNIWSLQMPHKMSDFSCVNIRSEDKYREHICNFIKLKKIYFFPEFFNDAK